MVCHYSLIVRDPCVGQSPISPVCHAHLVIGLRRSVWAWPLSSSIKCCAWIVTNLLHGCFTNFRGKCTDRLLWLSITDLLGYSIWVLLSCFAGHIYFEKPSVIYLFEMTISFKILVILFDFHLLHSCSAFDLLFLTLDSCRWYIYVK